MKSMTPAGISLAILVLGCVGGTTASAQEIRVTQAPVYLTVEWQRPPSQDRPVPVVQANIADRSVEMHQYGAAAKQLITSGAPDSKIQPFSVWSGECEGPFAITFSREGSMVDLSGRSQMSWVIKTSGFHVVRPVVKLADGMLLVGDYSDASLPIMVDKQFSFANMRWLELDPEKVVTLGRHGGGGPGETWIQNPDLSKVVEVGFADLMPASGHGPSGWIHLGTIKVWGNPVPGTP
jgi:hypothetical protein